MRNFLFLSLLACLTLLTACSSYPTYNVSVDAICAPTAFKKKKYVLLPEGNSVKANDLQFQEFAAYTENALEERGFERADTIDSADVAILLSYGISEPEVLEYTCSVPIWGQTGGSSTQKSGKSTSSHGSTTYTENTTHTPSYGIIGSKNEVRRSTRYTKHMTLSARSLANYKQSGSLDEAEELWSTKTSSSGSSDDLRRIFPVLLVAAKPHIGRSTHQKLHLILTHDEDLAEEIAALTDCLHS